MNTLELVCGRATLYYMTQEEPEVLKKNIMEFKKRIAIIEIYREKIKQGFECYYDYKKHQFCINVGSSNPSPHNLSLDWFRIKKDQNLHLINEFCCHLFGDSNTAKSVSYYLISKLGRKLDKGLNDNKSELFIYLNNDRLFKLFDKIEKGIFIGHKNKLIRKELKFIEVTHSGNSKQLIAKKERYKKELQLLFLRLLVLKKSYPEDRIFYYRVDNLLKEESAFPRSILHLKKIVNSIKKNYNYNIFCSMFKFQDVIESYKSFIEDILEDTTMNKLEDLPSDLVDFIEILIDEVKLKELREKIKVLNGKIEEMEAALGESANSNRIIGEWP